MSDKRLTRLQEGALSARRSPDKPPAPTKAVAVGAAKQTPATTDKPAGSK